MVSKNFLTTHRMVSNSYANAETLTGKGFRRQKIAQLSGNEQLGVRFRNRLGIAYPYAV